MDYLKNVTLAVGVSAAMAAVFSYLMSIPDKFMLWFAFLLACSIVNGLTITPTQEPSPAKGREWRRPIFTGQTIHAPRAGRLKDPVIVTLLAVFAGVVAWIRLHA
jgi:hypothetical protein